MTEFLVFRLYGPMAAWGDVAVGEKRGVTRIPSRSAILGLLGAALGLRRDDPRLAELHGGYGIATRTDGDGALLVDFHTTQAATPASMRKRRIRTRREELLAGGRDLQTMLSAREYWTDLFYSVALWARPGAPWSLEALRDALLAPHFPLYLGRRSCPVTLPLAPTLVEGADPVVVLAAAGPGAAERSLLRGLPMPRTYEVAWEDFTVDGPSHLHTRRDQAGSRQSWQFDIRQEHRAVFERGGDVS